MPWLVAKWRSLPAKQTAHEGSHVNDLVLCWELSEPRMLSQCGISALPPECPTWDTHMASPLQQPNKPSVHTLTTLSHNVIPSPPRTCACLDPKVCEGRAPRNVAAQLD